MKPGPALVSNSHPFRLEAEWLSLYFSVFEFELYVPTLEARNRHLVGSFGVEM